MTFKLTTPSWLKKPTVRMFILISVAIIMVLSFAGTLAEKGDHLA